MSNNLSAMKRAIVKIDRLQSKLDAMELRQSEPVAIVGMSCRLPGGTNDPDSFWRVLHDGVDLIGEVPDGRWDDALDLSDFAGMESAQWGGFLDSVDQFDPQAFGIAPREAAKMDPQQRLFLEVAWEAIEDSGHAPDRLAGSRSGVYVGVCTDDYASLQKRDGNLDQIDAHYASGIAHSIVSGRVSYLLGLLGPSITIDTACSSSLVAVHLACQAIRSGEISMAIAGGVNIILLPDNSIAFTRADMMAADGRCKTFDASADGFVRAEGAGAIVLKPLSAAVADGDRIHALIRGAAVNQDGPSSGLTAPNGPSQEAVIRDALANGQVDPDEVSFVEAHGTGTSLGDPIEVQALGAALCKQRTKSDSLKIGSVKSNLGHLEAAAGIAGLIKVVLALKHREIPGNLHLNTLNPHIAWDKLPLEVPRVSTPWPAKSRRIAGVSSFGFGGTNAHVVLQEAPAETESETRNNRDAQIMTLSARDKSTLVAMAQRYAEHVDTNRDQALGDICYTANVGRSRFTHRLAVVARSHQQLAERLQKFCAGEETNGMVAGKVRAVDRPDIAFLFTGQGSQYGGMAKELYAYQPRFREILDRCDEILRSELDESLLSVIFAADEDATLLNETAYTQPALFALEYSLARMWMSAGVAPGLLAGHSVGEFAAACIAGVFDLEDGLKLIAARGRLMNSLPDGGRMITVQAPPELVAASIAGKEAELSIAAINGPLNVVVSGAANAIESVSAALLEKKIQVKPLTVSHAFHSPLMDPILEDFREFARSVEYREPQIPLLSNITGRAIESDRLLDADYWVEHLRQPVQFQQTVNTMVEAGVDVFLEIGPHPTLQTMAMDCAPGYPAVSAASLRRGEDDVDQFLHAAGQLFVAGVDLDWEKFEEGFSPRRVTLPTYPFQRARYWIPTIRPSAASRSSPNRHPLVGLAHFSPLIDQRVFEIQMSRDWPAYLDHHRVFDMVVFPAAGYIEMVIACATEMLGHSNFELRGLDIREALTLPESGNVNVQLVLIPEPDHAWRFEVISFETESMDKYRTHAAGSLSTCALDPIADVDIGVLQERCNEPFSLREFYPVLARHGIALGPFFQNLRSLGSGDGESLGRVVVDESLAQECRPYWFHPVVLDACLQSCVGTMFSESEFADSDSVWLPMGASRAKFERPAGNELWSHVTLGSGHTETSRTVDIGIYDSDGHLVARIDGLQLKRTDRATLRRSMTRRIDDWIYETQWLDKPAEAVNANRGSTAWLAEPSAIAEAVRPHTSELAQQSGIGLYDELLPDLDELCLGYVVAALRDLGWSPDPGDGFTTKELADELGIVDEHERLFARMLEMLEEDGLIEQRDQAWSVVRELPSVDVQEACRELQARFPGPPAELLLAARGGERLADALTGRCDAFAVIFPEGSFDAAHRLYRESPAARILNGFARLSIEKLVAGLPETQRVRVLEIGAGTGGTTSFVLPELPAEHTEYVFTDVSQLFLVRAQEGFESYPFVKYRLLDIENDPLTQGFQDGSFDLIIAANVLHATIDLRQTLQHVRRLLAPGGQLLLLEGTRPQRWIDLSFGLTEGWWRFQDVQLRPDYALLPAGQWRELLETEGFEQVAAIPGFEVEGAIGENVLLLARASEQQATTAPGLSFVVFTTDRAGDRLADILAERGHRILRVRPGKNYENNGVEAIVNPVNVDDYVRLLADFSAGNPCHGVIHAWAEAARTGRDMCVGDLREAQIAGSRSLLHLVQSISRTGMTQLPRLWVVTRGVQAVADVSPSSVSSAPIWGLARVVDLEHPDLLCTRIDLDPRAPEGEADHIVDEILSHGSEREIALRGESRYVARLVHRQFLEAETVANVESAAEILEITAPGVLDSLKYRKDTRQSPGAGQVEIEVRASGLNFRDVLIVLGMYPEPVDQLGGECAGIVLSVGSEVEGVVPGDEVVAMAAGSFGSHVIVDSRLVLHKPSALTFEEAATIPSAYLTAHYTLVELANIESGDKVLIHAAAGGVGQAAIKLAQRAGAEIFATAGSEEKRGHLASMGVDHVMNSRNLDFVGEINEITDSDGVDIVLNCLSGEFVDASVSVLAEDGCFLEIGKRDIWDPDRFRAERPDASYHIVDLAAISDKDPARVGAILEDLMLSCENGAITPLTKQVFPHRGIVDAFRYMAQARHIGKIVLTRSPTGSEDIVDRLPELGTILITGGLGGLGLAVAEWLVDRGAQSLCLMGRSAASGKAAKCIESLRNRGATVKVLLGDVSLEDDVRRILGEINDSMSPLQGIIHSAGILDDGVLLRQSWPRFEAVIGPKVDGAWNLHLATQDSALEFFILFSSISSVLGSPGQGNHSAANAFLDALAYYRRSIGLPAQSISWGAWSEIGAAAKHNVGERISSQGMEAFSPAEGLEVFEHLLRNDPAHTAVMPVDWTRFAPEMWGDEIPPFVADLVSRDADREQPQAQSESGSKLVEEYLGAPADSRTYVVLEYVRACAVRALGFEQAHSISDGEPLQELGLDSLMAIELRNMLGAGMGREHNVPATVVFDYPTIQDLTRYVEGELGAATVAADDANGVAELKLTDAHSEPIGKIEALDDEEVERMLAERLGNRS